MQASELLPKPPAPSGLQAKRIDATKIRLQWNPWSQEQPVDSFDIYRADDFGQWHPVLSQFFGGLTVWIDENAPPNHDYRYVASASGFRRVNAPGFFPMRVASAPSAEVQVSDALVTIRAGATMGFEPISGQPPSGFLKVGKFFPEASEAPVSDPWILNGPFGNVRGTWEQYGEQSGFLTRGVVCNITADVESNHLYKSPFIAIELPNAPQNPLSNTGIRPTPTISYHNESFRLQAQSIFAIFNAHFDAEPEKGFDPVSNPKWQMIPDGLSRTVKFTVKPAIEQDPDSPLFFSIQSEAGITRDISFIPPGETPVTLSVTGVGEKTQEVINQRSKFKLDVRARKTPTVGVYMVHWLRTIDGVRLDAGKIKPPTKAALEAELHRVYGEQANIWFNATIIPEAQSLDFADTEDVNGNGRCDLGTSESVLLEEFANNNGYNYTIFLFDGGRWSNRGGRQGRGGEANAIPGRFVFTSSSSPNLYAHELGHLMGLFHAFQYGTGHSNYEIPDDSDARVMGYGLGGIRVIKPERDVIHTNVRTN